MPTIEVTQKMFDRLFKLGSFPETWDDVLIRLVNGAEPKPVRVKRKYVRKITCEVCGKNFKGPQGLGAHRSRVHGIKKNDAITVKTKAKKPSRKRTVTSTPTD